jgi:endogenous inhibitor of DNA gyrase (YacG/DUF329 family)
MQQPLDFHPAPGQCPICAAPSDPAGRATPFCSDRCRWIDLGRWFRGEYRVPAVAPLGEDDEEAARGDPR